MLGIGFAFSATAQLSTPPKPNAEVVTTDLKVAPAPEKKEVLKATEMEFNFGKIPQGKPVYHKFSFMNVGTDSLKLDNVQAGCGCTTPEWAPGPYAAGNTFTINVGFNAGVEGPFTKPVTIMYAGQSKVIYIKGEVWKTPETAAPANNNLQKLKEN